MEVFLKRSSLIEGDLGAETIDGRKFKHLAIESSLSGELLQTIDQLAELRMPFPAREPRTGRSIYAITDPAASPEVKGLKMKGALGLKYESSRGKFSWTRMEPLRPYRDEPQLHITLTPDLNVEIKASSRKAMFCLSAEQALKEFACQKRLASVGLGFRGLAAGEFLNRNTNQPERDFLNRNTGAVFVEHKDGLEPLTRRLMFIAVDMPSGQALVMRPGGKNHFQNDLVREMTLENLRLFEEVGRVKIRCAIEAGVARHSAQPDNFWIEGDKIYVTDTDSCLLYEEIEPQMKGPQLLRDAASDMLHCISTVSYFAYSKPYRESIESGELKPFHAFMRGYFGEYSSASAIDAAASTLQKKYVDFLEGNKQALFTVSEFLRRGILSGRFQYPLPAILDTWNRHHFTFLSEILDEFYWVHKGSRLPALGFTLPELDEAQAGKQFHEGVDKYVAAIQALVLASKNV